VAHWTFGAAVVVVPLEAGLLLELHAAVAVITAAAPAAALSHLVVVMGATLRSPGKPDPTPT